MRAIKALVIGMGILIVAGLILLGYGFYSNVAKLSQEDTVTADNASPTQATTFGTVTAPVADGARVVEMVAAGGRVVLRLAAPQAPDRLLVFDPASGRVTGRLELVPGDAAPAPAPAGQ